MSQASWYYKLILGLTELLLAVPILGATIVVFSGWTILGLMCFLHIMGLVLSILFKKRKSAHIFGIFANLIAYIPIIGMTVHAITGVILLIQAFHEKS